MTAAALIELHCTCMCDLQGLCSGSQPWHFQLHGQFADCQATEVLMHAYLSASACEVVYLAWCGKTQGQCFVMHISVLLTT